MEVSPPTSASGARPGPGGHPHGSRAGRRVDLVRVALVLLGIGLITAGVLVVAVPLVGVWQRGRADSKALQDWNAGGSSAITGVAGDSGGGTPPPLSDFSASATGGGPPVCGAASAPADDYALVEFANPKPYGYAGVAGNGTWDELLSRSMVHYRDTPAPGEAGNVIIAFHREPNFEHIDQLKTGDEVIVQDRGCHVFRYRITDSWKGSPDKVSQLGTTSGHELTLITCDPWYQDYNRLVWRAELES